MRHCAPASDIGEGRTQSRWNPFNMAANPDPQQPENWRDLAVKRGLPLAVLALLVVGFFASGLHTTISFDELARRYGALTGFVNSNLPAALLVAVGLYALAVSAAFPAAWLLTVAYGLVFGWALGAGAVVLGASVGASILFFVAGSLLADFFRARAGDRLNAMAEGFRADAANYMLFLRLAPVFPFLLVNVVPAILGVPFRTFLWTTAIGIIPGSIAYAYAGEGLRSIIGERAEACAANVAPCGEPLTPGDIVTPQILIAFFLLAVVSLLPVVLKRLRRQA